MKGSFFSYLAASVLGGIIVAVAFLALGVTGRRTTQTVIEEAPTAAAPSRAGPSLTPHAIYARDAPGVAFVRAQLAQRVRDPFDPVGAEPSSVSTGSGFLIDRRGYLLTAYHLVNGAAGGGGVTVQFQDNLTRTASVVGQDRDQDLALLKVDMSGVPPTVAPLELGDSTTVRVGDPTLGIGNPFGLDRTLTSGIVSALQRQVQAPSGFSIDNVIQTDAPLNPANSGGPLLDATGKVIGINSQMSAGAAGAGSVGIGFAVPVNTAKDFLAMVRRDGPVKPS